jgi:hypothetical protein
VVRAEQQVLQRRQVVEQREVLEHPGDAARRDGVRRRAQQRRPGEADLAGLRPVHAGDAVEQRGLAGAVGADHGVHALLGNRQRHAVQRGQAGEFQRHVIELQERPMAAIAPMGRSYGRFGHDSHRLRRA